MELTSNRGLRAPEREGEIMERKKYHTSGKEMDYSDIDERFVPYLDRRERVEVEWKDGFEDLSGYGNRTDGKKARFYVGISTGWKPILLQIYSRRSMGGTAILSIAVKTIRGLGIYKY
jgi:hypothetical protein